VKRTRSGTDDLLKRAEALTALVEQAPARAKSRPRNERNGRNNGRNGRHGA
jgi:hypothetical protein